MPSKGVFSKKSIAQSPGLSQTDHALYSFNLGTNTGAASEWIYFPENVGRVKDLALIFTLFNPLFNHPHFCYNIFLFSVPNILSYSFSLFIAQ